MVDNNIIQSLGAGSGIDTGGLVRQLVEIERAAPEERLQNRKDLTQSQISDFGLMSSALSTLRDSAKTLTDPEGLFSKSASFTESTALVPTSLTTDVQPGVYTFTVEAIAQSQSLSSSVFDDPSDAVGEGTLTFAFGDVTASGGAMTAFDQDTGVETVDVVIDSSNNTLEGLRDAINDAEMGVQAAIVFNGTGYVLQINAESGAENEIQISVSDDDGENDDTSGLSRFAFNTSASNMSHDQDGADAELTLNGLSVYRETNVIDDIVEGLSLDVREADPGTPITVTVTEDKSFAEQSIRAFVDAYNEFLEAIEPIVGTYEEEDDEGNTQTQFGSLANDALARSMLTQIRSVISSEIPGLTDSNFKALGAIGIRTELDGTISIDEETFSTALEDNFEDIQKLLAPHTSTSDSSIYINSFNSSTTAGEYEVSIDTPPAKGYYTGSTLGLDVSSDFPLDTSGKTYTFTIEVNGTESEELTIPSDTYDSIDDLIEALQDTINNDENLSEDGAQVLVTYDTDSDQLIITSTKYGDSSEVNINDASTDLINDLGLAIADGTEAGSTVAGSINGVSGFGSANVLLPNLNEPGAGLALVVGETATTATVNFSRGFAGELEALIDEFLASNGLINTREANLEDTLDDIEEDEEALDRRMTAYEERLIQQFINMERILSSLNTSGSFVENLINTLPFTSKKD